MLLVGCNNSSTSNNVTTASSTTSTANNGGGTIVVPTPVPTPPPVTVTAANASALATYVLSSAQVSVFVPFTGSASKSASRGGSNTSLPCVIGAQQNSTALGVALAVALNGGNNVFSSPLGGSSTLSMPTLAKAQYIAQWRILMDQLASVGITTACDMLTGAVLHIDPEANVFAAIEEDPTNPVRLRSYVDSQAVTDINALNIFPMEGNDRLRFVGAKFISDGSTQGLTAGLNFPYAWTQNLPAGAFGLLDFVNATALFQALKPFHDRGFQVAIHANGDAALDQTISALSMLTQSNPRPDPRFRVEHFTVHQNSELAGHVAAAQQLHLEVGHTIGHVYFWGEAFYDWILGNAVSENIDPVASLMAAGVNVAVHSDSPVTAPFPLLFMQIAVTRLWQVTPQRVLGPQQAVSAAQAIKLITINAAHSTFFETKVGSLQVGKYADLVILGSNPLATDPTQIMNINVLATYLEGKLVYGTGAF